jgi:hypothetical protein
MIHVGSNFKWLGPNTAPGIATSYPSPKSSFSGQYEKTISGSHSCEWKLHSILTFFAWYEISMLTYRPRKKYCNTLIFSLHNLVRRKCSITGRNLLNIHPECFKLNHWHIERHTFGSHSCEWKLHSILTFFAWYEISKSNDSVWVQIVLKWWNSRKREQVMEVWLSTRHASNL